MSLRRLGEIEEIKGSEGSAIKQIFHPHNTLDGINHSLAHCSLESGKSTAPHQMKTSETFYILEGTGILHIDGDAIPVSKDDAVFVPPMSKQHIENSGSDELRFLCIVDPPWTRDSEIISG